MVTDKVADISFPLRASILAALGVLVLTGLYWRATHKLPETVLFLAGALAASGAVMSAFYSARSLAVSLSILESDNKRKRQELALKYVSRWNEPAMYHIRDTVRELFKADHNSEPFKAKLAKDETNVITFLNFLEEIAIVLEKTDADPDLMREAYGGLVPKAWSKLQDWIREFRRVHGTAKHWEVFERLVVKWRS